MSYKEKYEQLLSEHQTQKEELQFLRAELSNIKKLIYGSKRERHISSAQHQGNLFAGFSTGALGAPDAKLKTTTNKPVAKKKKAARPVKIKGFPAHLKRVEELINPKDLPADATQIGEDVTEILAYKAGYFYVRRIIRSRLASKSKDKVYQANIPDRLIPKGKLDESVIAKMLVDKIYLHMPVHRFHKAMKLTGSDVVSTSTLQNSFHKATEALTPLYELLKAEIQQQSYLQADESPIKVLNNEGKKKTSKGYMWIYRAPLTGAVLFDYQAGRTKDCPEKILAGYQGYLQVDGYAAYDQYQSKPGVELLNCMAHARRKFVEAKTNNEKVANYFLDHVAQLYAIERQAREEGLSHQQRFKLREKQAITILHHIKEWLQEQLYLHPPKSPIAEAIAYTNQRWPLLCVYASDGQLEIDNNLIENKVRPLALGRKNYLFAHNEHTAQNLAMLYSFFGTCEACGVNPQKYMSWILNKVVHHKIDDSARQWLPQYIQPDCL